MKINSVYTINFGKTPIALCNVKKAHSIEKKEAEVYLMDPSNKKDVEEIIYSKTTYPIRDMFLRDSKRSGQSYRKYYVLKDTEENKIVSYAATSRRFNPQEGKYKGCYTLIEELGQNHEYNDPLTPTIACIINEAEARYDKHIFSAVGENDDISPRACSFSLTKRGDWVLPQKRYGIVLEHAEKRNDIVYY